MQIKRTINNNETVIELTDQELFNAYCEQQFIFDRSDITDVADGIENEDDFVGTYGIDRKTFDSLLDDMAYEMRRNIDKYEMSWEYARDDAITTVIRRHKHI